MATDEVLFWLLWNDRNPSGAMAIYRYRRAFTPNPDPVEHDFTQGCVDDSPGIIDRHFEQQPFMTGDHPAVADLSMIGHLVFPKQETGYDLAAAPSFGTAWLEPVAALPEWSPRCDQLVAKQIRCYV